MRTIDLNLLVALDTLLEEASVSSAAQRLGMSQPSASAALERCRQLFGDPLLVRSGRRMARTARGDALRDPVRSFVDHARDLIGAAPETARTSQRTVRIVSSDFPATTLLQRCWAAMRDSAPGIDLVLLAWRESDEVVDALARDHADIAITVLPQAGSAFRRTEIYRDSYCLAMRRDHPLASELTMDRWLAYPHLVVSAKGARRTPLDDQLTVMGRERRVGIVVPGFMMVPPLLRHSDLVAMIPCGCSQIADDLHYCDPPIATEEFPLHLATAARSDSDCAIQHVAELIRGYFPRAAK
ncbi:Nodulation protein D 2 [Brevundimonas vesicularis]|uniref:Nodulation protein D 2 n=1 Tax=Brevundimonas vesicularis TaxID=41276 RepID=A0A2X1D2M3_BREVE|nr:LysR family transcriptional regulator [Brevundimonas vesicularis]SPU54805.1 Nodulation protein D 2 [Brevundimonas vesicularis]